MSGVARLAVLTRARELLAQGWCQGAAAQTARGRKCLIDSPRAVAWCVVGAVMRASRDYEEPWEPLYAAGLPKDWPQDWNDAPERTQADVLALVDRAIEAETRGEA